ncbi:hypothetical protein V2S04_08455 [Microbacterium sp. OR21]|jgi:hypothetical protein|uniref:hypothetical protein n=1 Tax=Microbacterium sp. OR21 TaxID=3095346 RepID=UPI0039B52D5E
MSDPTPFPTDPMKAEGTDPDLSTDAQTPDTDEDAPDDREPTFDEQQQDRLAAQQLDERGDEFTHIP